MRPGRRRCRAGSGKAAAPGYVGASFQVPSPYHGHVAVRPARRSSTRTRCARDFPIFEQLIHGKPLAFLDSAASSQKPRQMLEAMNDFYSTSYANVHRGVYVLAERATAALEGAREKVRALAQRAGRAGDHLRPQRDRGDQPRRVSWGLANLGPGDLVVVTELEHHSNFVPWQYIAGRTGAELAMIPLTDEGELDLSTLDAIAAQGNDQGRRDEPGLELARHDQPGREARRVGARAGRDLRLRRGAVRAAHDGRRAGARRRLRRDLRAQDVRPERRRRALGTRGAAARDGAVPHRRPHDQLGAPRQDDVGRAAAQVRGRHGADGGGGRLRLRRSTTSRRSASTRSRRTSTSSPRTRSAASASSTASRCTARPPSAARASSRSTSTASIRTTSRRSSTCRASRSAQDITAASR